MKVPTLPRRTVLAAAGACLGLPWLEAMREARADAAAPLRFIVMYTPNGTVPANFWPQGEGRDFVLSPILQPLAPHQEQLLVVGGLDIRTGNGPGDPHQRGTGACLTGRPLLEGNFSGDANAVAGWASGESVDQRAAALLSSDAPVRSLEFGVMVEDPTVRGRISYAGAGKPLPPENSPSRIYERVFEPGLSKQEKNLKRKRRKHLVDRLSVQYKALQKRLGADDRGRLESHVESLMELETQLGQPGVELGGSCPAMDVPVFDGGFDYELLPDVGRAQLDVLTLMLRCDVTRVASIMWTNSQSTASYPISVTHGRTTFSSTGAHHGIAHKGDEEAEYTAKNTAINTFFAEQLAYLVAALKAVPEGDGSLFDNTVILWTNEQNKGNTHDMGDMPYVLLGNAGGRLKTGRYVRLSPELGQRRGERGPSHNRLLTTLLTALGSNEEAFGDSSEHDASALNELLV